MKNKMNVLGNGCYDFEDTKDDRGANIVLGVLGGVAAGLLIGSVIGHKAGRRYEEESMIADPSKYLVEAAARKIQDDYKNSIKNGEL